eukprot:COSAG02_NODE_43676_length_372_cov_1.648352_1_plen_68_part_01
MTPGIRPYARFQIYTIYTKQASPFRQGDEYHIQIRCWYTLAGPVRSLVLVALFALGVAGREGSRRGWA